jgi:hypothetical protein
VSRRKFMEFSSNNSTEKSQSEALTAALRAMG